MTTSHRILRAQCDELRRERIYRTPREQDRHERILYSAESLLARNGRANLSFSGLAVGLDVSTGVLRHHFVDVDAVLVEILTQHLRSLSRALGQVPWDLENRRQHMRAAYLAATRTPMGGFTIPHLLLTRDLHTLPPDAQEPIEQIRIGLGAVLGPLDLAHEVLDLLDRPWMTVRLIEPLYAALLQCNEPAAARQQDQPPPIQASADTPPQPGPPSDDLPPANPPPEYLPPRQAVFQIAAPPRGALWHPEPDPEPPFEPEDGCWLHRKGPGTSGLLPPGTNIIEWPADAARPEASLAHIPDSELPAGACASLVRAPV
jgi:AcrR family transcriptional regulator